MGRPRDPARPDRETLAELCKTKNATQIAAIYAKDTKTVCQWLRAEGLKAQQNPNKIGKRKPLPMDTVVQLADQGIPLADIAERFGVSYYHVRHSLLEIGWQRPTDDVPDPKGVNCIKHPKYSQTCEYGSGDVCMYVCFGMGRRPCPANDCTVYKKRTRKSGNGYGSTGAGSRWYD